MTRYLAIVSFVASVLVLCAIAERRWSSALSAAASATLSIPTVRPSRVDSVTERLDSARSSLVDNDMFRLANAPASVRYDPASDGPAISGSSAPVAPPPFRPAMTLKAIVGGPPWQAIIDGLPGQPPGTIARTGSTFDRLTVRAVTRDSVIVQGPDTSWVLAFRKVR